MLGIAVGVIGGDALASFLGGLIGLALPGFTIAPREIVLGIAVGVGVSVGAALVPAWQGTRVRALELLRNYGIRADYGTGVIQRLLARPARDIGDGRDGDSEYLAAACPVRYHRAGRRRRGGGVYRHAGAQRVRDADGRRLYATYGADAWISFRGARSVDFAGELRRDTDIAAAEGWVRDETYVQQTLTDLWGIPPTHRSIVPSRGRSWLVPNEPYEAVITTSLARSLGLKAGDTFTAVLRQRQEIYSIVGLVDDESTYLGSRATGKVFMTPENANRLGGRGNVADFFAVRYRDSSPAGVDAANRRVEQQFRTLLPEALAAYEDRASTLSTVRILNVLLLSMVIVVAAIGVMGLVNTLVLNITERRRELGILRAIGASGGALLRLLVSEGIVLGMAGFGLGLIGGYGLSRYLVHWLGDQLSPAVRPLADAASLHRPDHAGGCGGCERRAGAARRAPAANRGGAL